MKGKRTQSPHLMQKKTFDKIQHSYGKNIQQNRNRKKLHQNNKSHLFWKTHSECHTQW